MERIMTIILVFESKEEGTVMVGTDKELDQLTHPEIKKMIGEKILVKRTDNREIPLQVSLIQISTSMADKKNIGICVGKAISPEEIKIGSTIYRNQD